METEGTSKLLDRARPVLWPCCGSWLDFSCGSTEFRSSSAGFPGTPCPHTVCSGPLARSRQFLGFLLMIGLLTRPVAMILCGEMAVAFSPNTYRKDSGPFRIREYPRFSSVYLLFGVGCRPRRIQSGRVAGGQFHCKAGVV